MYLRDEKVEEKVFKELWRKCQKIYLFYAFEEFRNIRKEFL